MEIVLIQLICLVILFVVMTACGLIPVIVVWRNKSIRFSDLTSTLISLCNCLAGGVFIGMCFLGLFPYVHEKFSDVMEKSSRSTSFPLSEFVIVIGFFLILTLEQIILMVQKKSSDSDTSDNTSRKSHSTELKVEDESQLRLLETDSQDTENGSPDEKSLQTIIFPLHKVLSVKPRLSISGHSHCTMPIVAQKDSGIHHFILLLAVSIHSLFEGMTLGLQTEKVKILHLFLAVLIHEALVVFALGVNIAKRNMGFLVSLKYIVMVTGSIPVGILIGLLIGTTPGLFGSAVSAVLQGIAAGIFIHVTFMEIIPDEFSHHKNRLFKVLFLFIGFMIMALVNFALGDHK